MRLSIGMTKTMYAFILVASFVAFVGCLSPVHALDYYQRRNMLSPRERTFLLIAFTGDEAKAAEYAQVAGVNPGSIGGDPLSTWFFHIGPVADIRVQRIVFERFRQPPNPPNIGDGPGLADFCNFPNMPNYQRLEADGNAESPQSLKQRQEEVWRRYVDEMAEGVQSLLRYGVNDRALLTRMFVKCMSSSSFRFTHDNYDRLIGPMLKAGANINGIGDNRPVLNALKGGHPIMVERLVADGADVNLKLSSDAGRLPYGLGPCQPRADQSVYHYVLSLVRPTNELGALRIIRALASKGYSPRTKWGYGSEGNCKFVSLYDAVIDSGNLAYANNMIEVAENAAARAAKTPAAPTIATQPLAAASPAASVTAPAAPLTDVPTQMGAWRFIVEKGRPVAMATPEKSVADHLAGIRIECGAGGRLEYVPIALRLKPMIALYVKGMDDIDHTIPLIANRVAGADNAFLSKEFLGSEANYQRQGKVDNWGVEMSIDSSDTALAFVRMAGFSKVRSFMLTNCKK